MKNRNKAKPHERVLRLLKKQKRGLLRLVFSRMSVFLGLMLLQIGILTVFYVWLNSGIRWFAAVEWVFTLFMLIGLINRDMDPLSKLTWFALISLFPIPGCLLLLYTETDVGQRKIRRRLSLLEQESKTRLEQDETVLTEPRVLDTGTAALHTYMEHGGAWPVYSGTDTRYFSCGEDHYASMLEDLRAAERFIFLESFIIDEGEMWGTILGILAEKAAAGVEVRVLYDGMCEFSTLSPDYPRRMEGLGIRCRSFVPIRPVLSTQYNYRDHRKILVVDGRVAYTGGVNLADEYINRVERFGHWKDAGIRLGGSAVRSFTLLFLQMWNLNEHVPEWERWLETPQPAENAKGFVMPYAGSPFDRSRSAEYVYMDIINRAQSYVHIMTPYLIPDSSMLAALRFAARRGVDVAIILPGIPDKRMAYALAKAHYRELVTSGVRVYEYTPGFIHSKVFAADGCRAVVGTINLDYRSLYHHFECAAYLLDAPCIADIERDFEETVKVCRRVTLDSIRHERIGYRISGRLMRIIGPLM